MSVTLITDVQNQVVKKWSPVFMDELMEDSILATLVNRDYDGEIQREGDTVYVSQIQRPTGERKVIGTDDASIFNPEKLTTQRVSVVANQRITASFEIESLVDLQSQLGSEDSKIRQALLDACQIQLNDYLFSLVAPSTSAPDHTVTGVTDFNASQLSTLAKMASQARWLRKPGWWALVDPSYMSDLRTAQTLTSSDYVGQDQPVIGGQFVSKRFGFNIVEDNSHGLSAMSASGEDAALVFHPDWLYLVMQEQPTFQVSDLHANKQFGHVISVTMICGAVLGIDGATKHISVINA